MKLIEISLTPVELGLIINALKMYSKVSRWLNKRHMMAADDLVRQLERILASNQG